MPATTTTQVAADLQTYFSKKLLAQAKYKVVLDQFGYVEKIPSASSKTISFTQYADLTPATTPLTEGTPPSDTQLSTTAITATADQLGAYVTLTDLAELTVKHPIVQKTTELLGVQAARTYDQLIGATIAAGTNVVYAGAATSRATLTTANKVSFTEVKKAVAILRKNGATEFADGNFVLVVDPSSELDLMDDTTFQNTVYRQADTSKANENYTATITKFGGVTVVRSNSLQTTTAGTGGAVAGHISYVFGQNAYAVSDLQTLQMYRQSPGGVTDPLEQKMTMGWKVAFKTVILNNNFMVRIESGSTN